MCVIIHAFACVCVRVYLYMCACSCHACASTWPYIRMCFCLHLHASDVCECVYACTFSAIPASMFGKRNSASACLAVALLISHALHVVQNVWCALQMPLVCYLHMPHNHTPGRDARYACVCTICYAALCTYVMSLAQWVLHLGRWLLQRCVWGLWAGAGCCALQHGFIRIYCDERVYTSKLFTGNARCF